MRWYKWLGIAGAVGVVATGVVIARSDRKRKSYTADEIRSKLHERLAEAQARAAASD
jgi:hypothetical protein